MKQNSTGRPTTARVCRKKTKNSLCGPRPISSRVQKTASTATWRRRRRPGVWCSTFRRTKITETDSNHNTLARPHEYFNINKRKWRPSRRGGGYYATSAICGTPVVVTAAVLTCWPFRVYAYRSVPVRRVDLRRPPPPPPTPPRLLHARTHRAAAC